MQTCPNEYCRSENFGGARECAYCGMPLGADCQHCRNWRHTSRYGKQTEFRETEEFRGWCDFCIDEELESLIWPVTRVMNRSDRNGKHYFQLFADNYPKPLHIFQWNKAAYKILEESAGKWIFAVALGHTGYLELKGMRPDMKFKEIPKECDFFSLDF